MLNVLEHGIQKTQAGFAITLKKNSEVFYGFKSNSDIAIT